MKVSKSLLQAIVVGVTLGATAVSCDSVREELSDLHFPTCGEGCTIDHGNGGTANPIDSCPGCGMG